MGSALFPHFQLIRHPFTLHVIQRKTATLHILVLKSHTAPTCVQRRAKCHKVSCLKMQNKSFSPSVSTKENDILLQAYINEQLQLRYKLQLDTNNYGLNVYLRFFFVFIRL